MHWEKKILKTKTQRSKDEENSINSSGFYQKFESRTMKISQRKSALKCHLCYCKRRMVEMDSTGNVLEYFTAL